MNDNVPCIVLTFTYNLPSTDPLHGLHSRPLRWSDKLLELCEIFQGDKFAP